MACVLCRYAGAFILNGLNLADHALNWLLLGDADETVSARAARARAAGMKWAVWFCWLLTWLQKIVTAGQVTMDHCDYAANKSIKPNTGEIMDLNFWPPRFHSQPVNEE
jgi:hypothetical protein